MSDELNFVQKVMDGGIDPFIEAFLKESGGGNGSASTGNAA